MTGNLTSQAATMDLAGAPNDIISNLDPLALIIFIPIMDQFIYPSIRKMGFTFTPLKKIFVGYMMATMAMISATVIQYYIYKLSPCGSHASSCEKTAPINVWVQTVPYVLIAFSEIFAAITGYEYAYTKAPKNMKSLGSSWIHPSPWFEISPFQLADYTCFVYSPIPLSLHERHIFRHRPSSGLPVG